jgi:hypothetical protein
VVQFLAISARAQAYRDGLETKHVNARAHLRKIVALVDLHGKQAVARALDDGLELQAFSAEYVAHILSARRRIGEEPAALQLNHYIKPQVLCIDELGISSARTVCFKSSVTAMNVVPP